MKNRIYIILVAILSSALLIQTAYVISLERNQKIFMAKQRLRQMRPYFRLQDDPSMLPNFSANFIHSRPQKRTLQGTNGEWPLSISLQETAGFSPRSFILQELPDEYLVTMYLPGLNKEEISLELKNRCLVVSGGKKIEQDKIGKNYQAHEVTSRSFLKLVTLPEDIQKKGKGIVWEYKGGNLTVHILKYQRSYRQRRQN